MPATDVVNDTLDRADGAISSGGHTYQNNSLGSGSSLPTIVSNEGVVGSTYSEQSNKDASFNPATGIIEFWIRTGSVLPAKASVATGNGYNASLVRNPGTGNSPVGYSISWTRVTGTNTDVWSVYRWTAFDVATEVKAAATLSSDIVSGDDLCIRFELSTGKIYAVRGTTVVGSYTDGTPLFAGGDAVWGGFSMIGTNGRVDSLGGGYVAATAGPVFTPRVLGPSYAAQRAASI